MAASVALGLWLSRDTIFSADELHWMIDSRDLDLRGAIEPYNGHLILVPRLVYSAILNASGVDYLPFRLLASGAVVLTAGLFFAFAQRRIGALAALAPTLVLLFYGADADHALLGAGFTVISPLAVGIGALLALEREDRAGDIGACLLLCLALATYSTAIPFVAGAAVLILIGADRWRRAWVFLVPALLYGAWLLWSREIADAETGGAAASQITLANVLLIPSWTAESLATVVAAFLGLGYDFSGESGPFRLLSGWGPVVAAAAVVALGWRLLRGGVQKWLWALMAVPATLWVIGAMGALDTPYDVPQSTRYIFPATIAVLLVAVEAARGARFGRGAMLAVYAAAVFGVATNVALLRDGAARLHDWATTERADLATVEIARGAVGEQSPGGLLGAMLRATGQQNEATGYMDAVREFGSPAFSLPALRELPEPVREQADMVLAESLGARLEPASGPVTDCRRVSARPGEGSSFRLPPGGAVLTSTDVPSEVRLRRFGSAFTVPVGELEPGVPTTLSVPTDSAPDPWFASLPVTALKVCAGSPNSLR
jgi:hypothetical protein